MERSVAQIRAAVIALNIGAWFLFIGPSSPRAGLAITIIVVAAAYAIWSTATQPYLRWPLLGLGLATLTTDALLICLWVLATGGPASPFWIIFFISIVSVAMRYDMRQTMMVAAAEAVLLLGVMAADGAALSIDVLVRPGYLLIAGFAAGSLARLERIHREESVASEQLATARGLELAEEKALVEHLRELDRMKTEFITHASHELRTPLTTLSGLASTLAQRFDQLNREQIESALAAMHRQGERTRSLIENLLDLSQLEHGSMNIDVQPVSITSALREALQVSPPPGLHRVSIDLSEDTDVLADRQRLGQVVTNLLTNAYRYGGPNIRWESDGPANGTLRITITDDGAGVPATLEPLLFQPFRRGENIGDQTGSGLGLAISRKLVEAFGGELTYEHATPRGARFTLTLKRAS